MSRVCAAVFVGLWLAGCGLLLDLDPPDDASARDATVRADRPCLAVQESCNGVDDDCDARTDEGDALCLGGEVCVEGACACETARCDGACVDLAVDPTNCGACGVACDDICRGGVCCAPRSPPIDVLLVIDSSNSMVEEQMAFASLLRAFLERWDAPLGSLPALDSVHVGITTPDLGSVHTLPTCSSVGEDGEFQTRSRAGACSDATFPRFFSFEPDTGARDQAEEYLRCVMQVGTGGCGFEQPLEAMLKAVTPSTSSTRFFRDTVGLGDTLHEGFLRPDSILVVAIVTDEDDCSMADPDLTDPSAESRYAATDLNLRCHEHPEALHDVERYRRGLAAVHAPEDTILLVVGGIPPRLVEEDSARILDAPEMSERVDPSGTRLEASCSGGGGNAYPPRRLVELGRALEEGGGAAIYGTVCASNLGAPLERTLDAIAERYALSCPD